jgi:predicted DNA-binding transcriptional regulator YafY
LEVSPRTVYRDIAQLQHQGVPIEGEAGVGYRLGSGFDLPPLMFTQEEASALVATVRIAQAWLDPKLALAAEASLSKILSILPAAARAAAESSVLYAPTLKLDVVTQKNLQTLREAAQKRQKVTLNYRDVADKTSRRVVRPLGCFFWGKVWTLGAWCETRKDFRSFRLDRMQKITVSEAIFSIEAGKGLADYLGRAGAKDLL